MYTLDMFSESESEAMAEEVLDIEDATEQGKSFASVWNIRYASTLVPLEDWHFKELILMFPFF